VFINYQNNLKVKYANYLDLEDYALRIIEHNEEIADSSKYDYIFVDEVQDLDPMQIKALCLLTKKSIVITGDPKQKIYKKTPVTYEKLGLNIMQKGRRKYLNKNYRSTAQIVKLANSLKFKDDEYKLSDKLHVKDDGVLPKIVALKDLQLAANYIVDTINKVFNENPKHTVAIIHREEIKNLSGEVSNFRRFIESKIGVRFSDIKNYSKRFDYNGTKQVFYTNAYDIKGLEFDVVFIIDFNRYFYPNQKEIQKLKDEKEGKDLAFLEEDIQDIIEIEKKLLYVAMTRAKEQLYIIAQNCPREEQISDFIYDFEEEDFEAVNISKSRLRVLRAYREKNKV